MPPSRASVLLVDDDPGVVDALELLFEPHFDVFRASSVPEAREILTRTPVAVIVADERMPGESGVKLFAWCVTHCPSPIRILLTGYSEIETVIRAINEGHVWQYLGKPWHNRDLLNLVRRAVEFREQREARLAAEQRWRHLFDNAPTGLFEADPTGQLTQINATLARLIGVEPGSWPLPHLSDLFVDRVMGETFLAAVHADHAAELPQVSWRRADNAGRGPVVSLRALLREPKPEAGQTARVIEGSVHDLTALFRANEERAQLSEQIRKLGELDAANRLTLMLVHDLKNCLQIALWNASEAMDVERLEDMPELLQGITHAASRGSEIARQLMGFAQPDRSKDLQLNALARSAARLVNLARPQLAIELDLDESLPVLRGHANQLHASMVNLLLNAAQATDFSGRILIQTRLVPPDPATGAPWRASVDISDDGEGVPAELREAVFTPGFSTGQGNGLGLPSVMAACQAHGGTVRCGESAWGGARFTMLLDASDAMVPQDADGSGPVGGTVLFVDDEPALREVARRTLESLGYRPLIAPDGPTALALLQEHPVDLVVLDLVMPGMGGEQVWQAVQELRPGLPVLFCTAHSVSDDLHHRVGAGVRILEKPLIVETFAQAIHRAMRRAPVNHRATG